MSLHHRRTFLFAACVAALAVGCAGRPRSRHDSALAPVVFVHGNGDSAALWITTLWRFESNGWPRDRLFAIDLPYPLARDEDDKPQPGRTSSDEYRRFLAAEIDRVRRQTGAQKVILVGNSRGGYAIRSYLATAGARHVSHAVLGGTPNHGVRIDAINRPTNEFNGAGPFLRRLNAPQGADGAEVTPGVRWMTIRSDNNDKFAQPDGVWLGAKGTPTGVTFDGPALRGAENVVIAGVDHRESSFSARAFAETWRFITGRPPATPDIGVEPQVVLDGLTSGLGIGNQPGGGNFVNNLPLVGATVEVYATDPATGDRLGPARHRKSVGPDGRWGPFDADPRASYEFVVAAPGFAITHIYRRGFLRSSNLVHLRAERIADSARDARAVVTLTRPRGYFGLPRDEISLDGLNPPPGIPTGVAGVSTAQVKLQSGIGRSVAGEFNRERIVGKAWPTADNHVVLLELLH